ncbi:MAG: fibronectin type III domain-containing protein [Candidatus Coatesbacteria bacterium]|nr:MAG: fibronectin type III domain-containing protein [Candidatus Coatesbacteria bacterium]
MLLAVTACEEEIGSPTRPPAPNNLTAEVDGGSVRLRWNATNPVNYRLERSDLVPGNFNEIAQINGDTTEYLDSSVIFGDTYFYRVRGYDY